LLLDGCVECRGGTSPWRSPNLTKWNAWTYRGTLGPATERIGILGGTKTLNCSEIEMTAGGPAQMVIVRGGRGAHTGRHEFQGTRLFIPTTAMLGRCRPSVAAAKHWAEAKPPASASAALRITARPRARTNAAEGVKNGRVELRPRQRGLAKARNDRPLDHKSRKAGPKNYEEAGNIWSYDTVSGPPTRSSKNLPTHDAALGSAICYKRRFTEQEESP